MGIDTVLEIDKRQIKSRVCASVHGEIFSGERKVNTMLNFVKQETERIDFRFLEPACGTRNFLAEIFRWKLAVVGMRYFQNKQAYNPHAFITVASTYSVDVLQDNAVTGYSGFFTQSTLRYFHNL